MAAKSNTKRKDETDLQWRSRLARVLQAERDRKAPIVPPEAANQGEYKPGFVTHVETNTKAHTLVNRGGTPICRWTAAGKLTLTQLAAIDTCQRLWRLAGMNQRVTANYGERLGGYGSAEHSAFNEIEAREDLYRIKGYFTGLETYWDVFENIVRHQHAAGDAGAGPGYVGKAAQGRAHTVVCFVADIIAMRERL